MAFPTTRPDCGGIWATGGWGMRYWGGFIQCGEVPPIPPIPPSPGSSSGGSSGKKRRHIRDWTPPFKQPEIPRVSEAGDEEDLELILTMWLNLK